MPNVETQTPFGYLVLRLMLLFVVLGDKKKMYNLTQRNKIKKVKILLNCFLQNNSENIELCKTLKFQTPFYGTAFVQLISRKNLKLERLPSTQILDFSLHY